ncbi:MAG: hypothetical protein L0215_03915, partial [Gemmataceae bacterium]|nr:hypothetical protein [Gemmataceae bacterium]
RLMVFNSNNNQVSNTGGFGTRLSAGVDVNGNPQVYFTDGDNRLWRYNQGVFTSTGGFAKALAAGQAEVFFLDGDNRIWIYRDNQGFTNTGGFAKQFSLGRDSTGQDELYFTDGDNRLWRWRQGVFSDTGGFALTLTAGRQGEVAFSDGLGQLWLFRDQGGFTFVGNSVKQISAGLDEAGNDVFFFFNSSNQLWRMQNGVATNTGGFGLELAAGRGGLVLFTDGNHVAHLFQDGAGFTHTGFVGTKPSASLNAVGTPQAYFLNGVPQVDTAFELMVANPFGADDLDALARVLAAF